MNHKKRSPVQLLVNERLPIRMEIDFYECDSFKIPL